LTVFLTMLGSQLGLARAHARPPYALVAEDESGRVLPTFHHRGQVFVMGRAGERYNLRLENYTGRRVEAVVSVDGRDVLSGQAGDYVRQRGYIIPAYGSVRIEGFRTSLETVAAFRFTTPGNSYSARMGTPENVGVLGAAFFPEAPPRRVRQPIARPRARREAEQSKRASGDGAPSARAERRSGAAPAAASAPAEAFAESDDASNIGTEYGEARHSYVSEVAFKRHHPNRPSRLLTLRYDDRQGLQARGILPVRPARPHQPPEAFPLSRFAPPPPPRHDWH
jgi:hypothetical protein